MKPSQVGEEANAAAPSSRIIGPSPSSPPVPERSKKIKLVRFGDWASVWASKSSRSSRLRPASRRICADSAMASTHPVAGSRLRYRIGARRNNASASREKDVGRKSDLLDEPASKCHIVAKPRKRRKPAIVVFIEQPLHFPVEVLFVPRTTKIRSVFDLQTDESGAIRIAVLLEPVGVNESDVVVIRVLDDGREQ